MICHAVLLRMYLLLLALGAVVTAQTQMPSKGKTIKKEISYARHSTSVLSVAFSPDGKRIASAGGNRVKVTDLTTGKEVLKLKNSRGFNFLSVEFSPDGRWLAGAQTKLQNRQTRWEGDTRITTLFYAGETIIWDAQTGAVKAIVNDDNAPAWQIAFSPDGQTLAIGTGPTLPKGKTCEQGLCAGVGEVLLVNSSDWRIRARLRGKTSPIEVLAFSPDGKWLAGSSTLQGSEGHEAFIWNVETGALQGGLPRHAGPIMALAFSPDGRLLASAGRDRSLKIWNTQTWQLVRMASEFMISFEEMETLADNTKRKNALPSVSWLSAVAFSKDTQTIIGSGADGVLRFYRTSSGKISHVMRPRDWPIISWDSFWAISDPTLFNLGLWQSSAGFGFKGGVLSAMALSPDGKALATGGIDGKIRVMALD